MAKLENDGKQTWGTWEELLLACAVHRHGTESWNSVSAEIQKRSSNLRYLTASECRHKYLDLKRRFSRKLTLPGSGEVESLSQISTDPWLEELRRIRVDELRRELEQYDLSISSLQSKVKRLEEERQRSSNENSDLDTIVENKEHRRPNSPLQSVKNESISPDRKENSSGIGSGYAERDESCESVEKKLAAKSERAEQGRGTELNESMAESEGGAEEWKETTQTSDVQSSASLPRKETSEQDNEDQSPSNKDFHIVSQPSIAFVEILLSQSCGSHFSRRLETQETPEYSKVIKQHIDFEIIRNRIEEGLYNSSKSNFFRDLLLLINNAKVFYHKRSSEFKSAEQLRKLVMKQMTSSKRLREISPLIEKSSSKPSFSKPRMSAPIIACRRRTSLAPKPLVLLHGDDKNRKNGYDESVTLKNMKRGRTSTTNKVANRSVDDSCNVVKKSSNSNGNGRSKRKVVERLEPSSATDAKKRRKTNEKGSPVKKNNGRNRAVKIEDAPCSSSPPFVAKRSREAGEKEAASASSPRLKKRVRR